MVNTTRSDDADYLAEVGPTLMRLQAITRYLIEKLPGTDIVLLGLLPRGDPNDFHTYTQPQIISRAITKVNEGIK